MEEEEERGERREKHCYCVVKGLRDAQTGKKRDKEKYYFA